MELLNEIGNCGTGAIYNVPGSKIFRVGYTDASGKYIRESSGTANKTEAQKFLRKRMEAVSAGNFLGPRIEKVTVDELYADLLADYRDNGHAVAWAESVWNLHLKLFFGGMRASRVGTTQLAGYVEKRKGEGAARSTINRELALLRRAFSIGCNEAEPQKVAKVPRFGRFIVSEEGNERKGFVEESQYRKLAERGRPVVASYAPGPGLHVWIQKGRTARESEERNGGDAL